MILKKPIKKINHLSLSSKLLTVGYIAFLYSSSSLAAPPVAFFSNGCPNGYVCETNVVSDGMTQRKLIDSNGNMFFQVTIVDGAANNGGLFEYDSFVNGSNGNTLGGISAKLDITETGLNNLNYSTVLNLGWANDGSAAVGFSQTVTDNYQGVGFEQSFDYEQNQTTQGGITGYKYDLFQRVVDSSILNDSNRGGEDIHTFVLRRASGDFVSSGSASLGGGGGRRMKAVLGSVSSSGTSSAATTTYQNAFVPDPAGYGTDGTSTGTIGDAQTAPGSGTVFGQEANPTFPDPFNGSQSNTLITTTVGDYNTSNRVNTSNTGLSTGDITSNGVASGADAPTSEVYVATGSSRGMGMGGGGGTDIPGGTVRWNTGDEVQVLWIGQSCPGCTVSGMGMMGGGSSGSFSFQQYENLTNGDIAAARSIRSTSPLNWDTSTFGPEPSL